MRDLMLDLETWGLRPGCAIRSIGAVMFDPTSGNIGEQFYANVDRASCESLGMIADPSTIAWWEKQSQSARDSLLVDPVPVEEAAVRFCKFFDKNHAVRVWSQGANFDEPILTHVLTLCGTKNPWRFWDSRCTRTAYAMAGFNFNAQRRTGTHHNALDDALHQARCVQKSYRMLKINELNEGA